MTIPIGPPSPLMNKPCKIETIAVRITPPIGPKRKLPMRIGISAGSYFINGIAGKIGKLINITKIKDKATSIAIFVNIFIFNILTLSIFNLV